VAVGTEARQQPPAQTGGTRGSEIRRRLFENPTEPLLALAVLAAGTLLIGFGSKLTFLFDDWQFLIDRQGWSLDTLLDPHNEHIALAPIVIYKALLAIFGMDSALPFRVVSTLLFLSSAALLYVFLRRRIDPWLALAGAILILFVGASYEDLLWSFQMAFFGSMAFGLGVLLALERKDRSGDLLACGLLAVSMAFSSLGLSFAAGAVVEIGLRPDRWRRAYVAVLPVLLFGIWWLGWGHTADNALSWHNLGMAPLFVLTAIATGLSSLLGLSAPTPESLSPSPDFTVASLDWGRPLLVAAALLAGWRIYKLGRIPRWLWIVAAIGFSFWILAALNAKPGRNATAGRYQYVTAVFIVLIAAELLRGIRVDRRGVIALVIAVGAIVISDVAFLHQGYKLYRTISRVERADLAALDIVRGKVAPEFTTTPDFAGAVMIVNAERYYQAKDDFGTPAYTPSQLARAPDQARVGADNVLARALDLKLAPTSNPPRPSGPAPVLKGPDSALVRESGSCLTVRVSKSDPPLLELPAGGVLLRSEGIAEAEVRLRRFTQRTIPVDLGQLARGATDVLSIPTDRSNVPWKLSLDGSGAVAACGLGAAAANGSVG
jgi:hypothetical protein